MRTDRHKAKAKAKAKAQANAKAGKSDLWSLFLFFSCGCQKKVDKY